MKSRHNDGWEVAFRRRVMKLMTCCWCHQNLCQIAASEHLHEIACFPLVSVVSYQAGDSVESAYCRPPHLCFSSRVILSSSEVQIRKPDRWIRPICLFSFSWHQLSLNFCSLACLRHDSQRLDDKEELWDGYNSLNLLHCTPRLVPYPELLDHRHSVLPHRIPDQYYQCF